jgi:hypothetical protein
MCVRGHCVASGGMGQPRLEAGPGNEMPARTEAQARVTFRSGHGATRTRDPLEHGALTTGAAFSL